MTIGKMKLKKKQRLRNNEYYDIQNMYDDLYKRSAEGGKFKDLMRFIFDEKNILSAYRNIKKNKGSKTRGTNFSTITDVGENNSKQLIEYVRGRLANYEPNSIRRVELPKADGKLRPLGIATIEDRFIQQCIKQVLEPICEAKFHKHSYGFRPNRSTHHALARAMYLMQKSGFHYVVDVDVKGFFDNVNHNKLLKQMWTLGIQDKNLISIISKQLKSEIEGIGIPIKGTCQGGVISPLLSNIVLNELDWWVSDQWETFKTNHTYAKSNKYEAMRKTNLKEIFIVRYADDFKIFCKNHKTAQKAFIAVKMWLKERLNLEISAEKSKVINLRKNYSNFLGFKLKVHKKGRKKVVKSHISEKATKQIRNQIIEKIKAIKKNPNAENVNKYNAAILGIHNYYKYATNVSLDFNKIAFLVNKSLCNKTQRIRSDTGIKSKAFIKYYGAYNYKPIFIAKIALFPIAGIKMKFPLSYSQDICSYTTQGRSKIHDNLKGINQYILRYLMENPDQNQSVEFNDNRISLYVCQNGKCSLSGEVLKIENMRALHITPKSMGGTDEYKNLIFITSDVYKMIHAKTEEDIIKNINKQNLDKKGLENLNKLRSYVGNCAI